MCLHLYLCHHLTLKIVKCKLLHFNLILYLVILLVFLFSEIFSISFFMDPSSPLQSPGHFWTSVRKTTGSDNPSTIVFWKCLFRRPCFFYMHLRLSQTESKLAFTHRSRVCVCVCLRMSGSMNGAPLLPSVVKLLLRRSFGIQTNCKLRLSEPHSWDDPGPGVTHPYQAPHSALFTLPIPPSSSLSLSLSLSLRCSHPSINSHAPPSPTIYMETNAQTHRCKHSHFIPSCTLSLAFHYTSQTKPLSTTNITRQWGKLVAPAFLLNWKTMLVYSNHSQSLTWFECLVLSLILIDW